MCGVKSLFCSHRFHFLMLPPSSRHENVWRSCVVIRPRCSVLLGILYLSMCMLKFLSPLWDSASLILIIHVMFSSQGPQLCFSLFHQPLGKLQAVAECKDLSRGALDLLTRLPWTPDDGRRCWVAVGNGSPACGWQMLIPKWNSRLTGWARGLRFAAHFSICIFKLTSWGSPHCHWFASVIILVGVLKWSGVKSEYWVRVAVFCSVKKF